MRRALLAIAIAGAHALAPLGEGDAAKHAARSAAASVRREVVRTQTPRATCDTCHRPPAVCVCAALPAAPIKTETSLLVLQHPNEFRRRHFSTTPLLPLCVDRCAVRVGYGFEADDLPQFRDAAEPPLLLFPAAGAAPLDAAAAGAGGRTVVLIDGTWAQAKAMARKSPSLFASATPVCFADARASALEAVRREPEAHCVSTAEAAARALRLLEPTAAAAEAADRIEASLRLMVDHQLASIRDRPRERNARVDRQ